MQVIIMAAGQGSRMKPLTDKTNKCLLPLNNHENFLSRILHQLNEYEVTKVVIVAGYLSSKIKDVVEEFELDAEIVINDKYKEDTNIYSMKLALDKIKSNESVIIIESDIYLDDLALRDIFYESKKNKSIFFTKNIFKNPQYGGILSCSNNMDIDEIKIVSKYDNKYKKYYKLLGIMTVGKNELLKFRECVNNYSKTSIKQYYLVPWIENLSALPCFAYDLGEYLVESVNHPKEYNVFINILKNQYSSEKNINLMDPNILLDIEEHKIDRKKALKEKILKEGVWTKPIIVEKNHNLVLDGHHRFNIAKELGMNKIPVILVDYKNIEIWSLREKEKVNKDLVISKAKTKNIYPNKTVKHKFEFKVPNCIFKLKDLY